MPRFEDPDTLDFFDAWRMSLSDREQFLKLREQAFGAGWDAAMRAVREARKHEERVVAAERAEDRRWQ